MLDAVLSTDLASFSLDGNSFLGVAGLRTVYAGCALAGVLGVVAVGGRRAPATT